MKRLKMVLPMVFILTIGSFYGILCGGNKGVSAMSCDNELFYTDMYFGYSFDGEGDQIHVFAGRDEVEEYILTLIDSQPEPGQMIKEFFVKFDEEFFAENKLIIAIVDRGSGMLRFEVESVSAVDGILEISVNRLIPPIQTMDYRQWVMVLPVGGSLDFEAVKITMRDIELSSRKL